jgi:hypothetical protein
VALRPGSSYTLELSVEGLPPAEFELDTGMGETMVLLDSYTREHHLLESRSPRSERLTRGVSGGSTSAVATLKRVSVAGFDLKNVPAEFYRGSKGAFHTKRYAGLIGAGLLERFRIVVDFPHQRLHVCPAAGWKDKPFRKNHTGLQVDYRGDHLEVIFVAPGSPAERGGWKIGQRVRAINGKSIGSSYLSTDFGWSFGQPGSTVVLTDGDGTARSLTLAEYY